MVRKLINVPTPEDVSRELALISGPLTPVPVISSTDDYEIAADALKDVKRRQSRLDTLRKTMTQPIDAAKKAVMSAFDPELTRLSRHELMLKGAMKEYGERVERERRLLEAKLRDEHRIEQEKAEARAAKLIQQGKDEQAETVLTNVRPVPVVVAARPVAKGISERNTWKASVDNLPAFIQWCLDEGEYELLEPDMARLNAMARSMRGTGSIPGILFREETTIVARS